MFIQEELLHFERRIDKHRILQRQQDFASAGEKNNDGPQNLNTGRNLNPDKVNLQADSYSKKAAP